MRWIKEIERKPYHGQERVVTKFALLPIRCESGECAWLEKVDIFQQFRIDPSGHWVNERLVDMKKE